MERRINQALMLILILIAVVWMWRGKSQTVQAGAEMAPSAVAWGGRISVYYPDERKLYVYSELGGNCIFAYTLSAPGSPITRENCK